jgi:phosphate transport system substrate-binding protein
MNFVKKFVPFLVMGLVLTGCAAQEEEVVVEEATELTGTINVYTRDASSGTREAFEGFIGIDENLSASAIEVSGNGDMAAKVGADAYGIGYVSLTTDFEANNVKALQYNGVDASIDNDKIFEKIKSPKELK